MSKVTIELDKNEINDGYYTMEELYDHMYALYAALVASNDRKAWRTRPENGWFLVGLDIGPAWDDRIVSYHIPEDKWDWFSAANVVEEIPEFKKGTPDVVVGRLVGYAEEIGHLVRMVNAPLITGISIM